MWYTTKDEVSTSLGENRTNVVDSFKYRDCFVCFLDALGCKNLVYKSIQDKASFEKTALMASLFYESQRAYQNPHWTSAFTFPMIKDGVIYDRYLPEKDIQVNMNLFSDSIIISYEPEQAERFITWYIQLHQIFNDICRLQFKFAQHGIFLRGGLSYGKLYHDGNVCFGPALINAVELEKKAINPCIAVDKSISDNIKRDRESNEIDDYAPGYKYPHVLKEYARETFIIYLNIITEFGRNPNHGMFMLDWILPMIYSNRKNMGILKAIIESELRKEYEPRIKEKYEWLKEYYNKSIGFIAGHENMHII